MKKKLETLVSGYPSTSRKRYSFSRCFLSLISEINDVDLASKYGNHLVVGLIPFFVFVQQPKLFSDSSPKLRSYQLREKSDKIGFTH